MRQLLPIFCILFLISCSSDPSSENEFPDMFISFENGGTMNMKELEINTVLILFQPNCDHCQREADAISKNLESFKGYGLFFVSTDDFTVMNDFARRYKLKEASNVYFARTSGDVIYNIFGSIDAPSVYIYKEGKLEAQFNGETPIDEIIQKL